MGDMTAKTPVTPPPRERGDVYSDECPCRDLMDVVANKWAAMVIGALDESPQRFTELARTLTGVTPRALTAVLRRLEAFELVRREVYAEVPTRVEYSLTTIGREALVAVTALREWAETHIDHAIAVDPRQR